MLASATASERSTHHGLMSGDETQPGELGLFFTAVMFYSRLRVPRSTPYSDDALNRSRRYFPFVGIIIGLIGAAVFAGANAIVSPALAVLASMVATVLATGAFHEDGFADTCDGLGGGMSVERKLAIMKDSRLGTYGATGLIMILGVKFAALHELAIAPIDTWAFAAVLVFGHTLSRQLASTIVDVSTYVQDPDTSKVKPIANSRLSAGGLATAWSFVVFAAAPVAIAAPRALGAAAAAALVSWWFYRRVTRSIGGYTGDTLGATQQLAEVALYIGSAALLAS